MCKTGLTVEVIPHDSSWLTKVTCMASVLRMFLVTITDPQTDKSKHSSDVFVLPVRPTLFSLLLFLKSNSERIIDRIVDRTEHRSCGTISDDATVPKNADC